MLEKNTYLTQEIDELDHLIESLHNTYNLEICQLRKKYDTVTKELEDVKPCTTRFKELDFKLEQTLIENNQLKVVNMELTKELETQKNNRAEIITEIDSRSFKEYGGLQFEEDIKRNKKKSDIKIENLENKLCMDFVQNDVNANSLHNELTQHINEISSPNNDHLRIITDLEQLKIRVAEIKEFVSQAVQEYKDLIHVELELSTAIYAYQKLLESEEKRKISNTSLIDSRRGKKRKLPQHVESNAHIKYFLTSSSTDDVQIDYVCLKGLFVKLYNKGSMEVELSGYQLVCATAEENIVFKFNFSLKLEAGKWLTLWSSTASSQLYKHSSELIVMNIPAWVVGNFFTTTLLNTEGKGIATYDIKKASI